MKFSKPEKATFEWDTGIKGWVYNSKEDFKHASGIYFEVIGKHGKVKTTCSDRIYFVLSGKGKFIIDRKSISVSKHDMIIVPKKYSL